MKPLLFFFAGVIALALAASWIKDFWLSEKEGMKMLKIMKISETLEMRKVSERVETAPEIIFHRSFPESTGNKGIFPKGYYYPPKENR